MTENEINKAINSVLSRMQKAAAQYDRDANHITLLAVSKTQAASKIRQAYKAGLTQFGENKLQEALPKILQCQDLNIEWHFIGPIQSNKTHAIAEHFSWVQSVDRLKIATRLNDQRPKDLPPLNICVQVNISQEPQKSGILPSELPSLLQSFHDLPQLKLRGLMCIPQAALAFEEQRQVFHAMRTLYQQFQPIYALDTLSMGMSEDLEAAIAEGSTMIRIGRAIFGSRP